MTIMRLGQRMLARLRAAVPESRVNYFVHAGNSLAVVASCSDEMVQLRSCMIGATTCGIVYNLLQPIPQWTPTYWGIFFVSAHSIQIARILRERSAVSMGEREHELYEKCFMNYGWTPRMFLSLLQDAEAEWVTLDPGEEVCVQGKQRDKLHLLTGGNGHVVIAQAQQPGSDHEAAVGLRRRPSQSDGVLSRLGKDVLNDGVWIGDCWEEGAPQQKRWRSSVLVADRAVSALRFDTAKFHEAIRALGKDAVEAAERMQIAALRAERMQGRLWQLQMEERNRARLRELERSHLQQRNAATYEAMLALAVADGVVAPEERAACAAFRQANGISDEQHRHALTKVGWDEASFRV